MGMGEVLGRAACFVGIILMGYVLRRVGFFKKEDFHVLAKIVLKITLPAAIINSFTGMEIDLSMLAICLLGLSGGLIYIALAYVMNLRAPRRQRAFAIQNTPGYNIGNFTLPFVQSFFGPLGVVTTSLFDAGNSVIGLGGAYGIASMVKGESGNFSLGRLAKTLISSFPFDCYIVMTTLCLLHIPLPGIVADFAEIIGRANAFLPMLMIGVGFELSGDRSQIRMILRILAVRLVVGVILSLLFFRLLPFALEIRQALAVLVFSPIASTAPAFTGELGEDIGLSSAVNSLSIVMGICCIVVVMGLVV